MLIIVSTYLSCCCGARASHTLSTHTTQHLILRSVSYHRFYKHMCAQAITSRSITFATTRNTRAAKRCQKSSCHLDTVQFSCPSSALVTLVHCDGHSRFITVSKSLYDFGHFFSTLSRVVTYSKQRKIQHLSIKATSNGWMSPTTPLS